VQYDLDDNGRLDSSEFVKMLDSLAKDVSRDEADAAMEVGWWQTNLVQL
jgi:Ca2+-binding EF-hand superfamily protein